jgi:hypothetical protein
MSELSVLIPPLLVAAAVIAGIVAFLRHEIGRARPDRQDGDEDNSAPAMADNADDQAGSDEDASAAARQDG